MPFQKGVVTNPKGRTKGSKNKTTLIKQQILEIFTEKNVKDRIGKLLEGNNKNDLKWFVDGIIKILPKDVDLDLGNSNINFIISDKFKPEQSYDSRDSKKEKNGGPKE